MMISSDPDTTESFNDSGGGGGISRQGNGQAKRNNTTPGKAATDDTRYEVDHIMDIKVVDREKKEILVEVAWKDHDPEKSGTWEPLDNIPGAFNHWNMIQYMKQDRKKEAKYNVAKRCYEGKDDDDEGEDDPDYLQSRRRQKKRKSRGAGPPARRLFGSVVRCGSVNAPPAPPSEGIPSTTTTESPKLQKHAIRRQKRREILGKPDQRPEQPPRGSQWTSAAKKAEIKKARRPRVLRDSNMRTKFRARRYADVMTSSEDSEVEDVKDSDDDNDDDDENQKTSSGDDEEKDSDSDDDSSESSESENFHQKLKEENLGVRSEDCSGSPREIQASDVEDGPMPRGNDEGAEPMMEDFEEMMPRHHQMEEEEHVEDVEFERNLEDNGGERPIEENRPENPEFNKMGMINNLRNASVAQDISVFERSIQRGEPFYHIGEELMDGAIQDNNIELIRLLARNGVSLIDKILRDPSMNPHISLPTAFGKTVYRLFGFLNSYHYPILPIFTFPTNRLGPLPNIQKASFKMEHVDLNYQYGFVVIGMHWHEDDTGSRFIPSLQIPPTSLMLNGEPCERCIGDENRIYFKMWPTVGQNDVEISINGYWHEFLAVQPLRFTKDN